MDNQTDDRVKNLKNLQNVEYEILCNFIKICEQEHLKYYALYGTALGAVRHQGFIPWDDDVDVGMPRDDYEKFLKIAPAYLNGDTKLVRWDDPSNLYYITRLMNSQTQIKLTSSPKERIQDAWIDIFPLDGLPNDKFKRKLKWYYYQLLKYIYLIAAFDVVNLSRKNRPWYQKLVIFLCKNIPINKLISIDKSKRKLDQSLQKQNYDESDYVFCVMGAYRKKEILDKSFFGLGKPYLFRDTMIQLPEDADRYLSQLYGDYMTPPPMSERNWHGTTSIE